MKLTIELSDQEREVLRLFLLGLSISNISASMRLNWNEVEKIRSSIVERFRFSRPPITSEPFNPDTAPVKVCEWK